MTTLVLCETCIVCREVVGLTARSQLLVQAEEYPTVLGVELSGPILSEPSRKACLAFASLFSPLPHFSLSCWTSLYLTKIQKRICGTVVCGLPVVL